MFIKIVSFALPDSRTITMLCTCTVVLRSLRVYKETSHGHIYPSRVSSSIPIHSIECSAFNIDKNATKNPAFQTQKRHLFKQHGRSTEYSGSNQRVHQRSPPRVFYSSRSSQCVHQYSSSRIFFTIRGARPIDATLTSENIHGVSSHCQAGELARRLSKLPYLQRAV